MKNVFSVCVTILLLGCITGPIKAQFGNVWAFGYNYGLDFNSGEPQLFDTTAVNMVPSAIAVRNAASICDSLGNLLFYTDGDKVWNRWHQRMANDDSMLTEPGINKPIVGFNVSPVIIFPKDGMNQYYLFTSGITYLNQGNTSYNNLIQRQLKYHVVDVAANNGNGAIVLKNQFLMSNAAGRLSATKHCNGRDWWVMTGQDNEDRKNIYAAFFVSQDSVSAIPVLSELRKMYEADSVNNLYLEHTEWLKFSPNGKLIATVNDTWGFDIAQFNNLTGQVNPIYYQRNFPLDVYFGGAFTADSKKFYLQIQDNTLPSDNPDFTEEEVIANTVYTRRVYKYALDQLDSLSIAQSEAELVVTDSIANYLNFQLAPDHKIYVTGALFPPDHPVGPPISKLFMIDPERDTLVETNIFLPFSGSAPSYGLSNFPDQIFTNHHRAALVWPNCLFTQNDTLSFIDSSLGITHDYAWDFGDPASGVNNTSDLSQPIHQFSGPGTYTVSLTLLSECIPFTIVKQITVVAPPPMTDITLIGNLMSVPFLPNIQAQWFFNGVPIQGSNTFQHTPQSNGTYSFLATNTSGCSTMSNPFQFNSLGYDNFNAINFIGLFPNPAQSQINLTGDLRKINIIYLYDLSGKLLESIPFNQQDQTIDIGHLSNGTYILQLSNSVYKKVVVCRD